MLGLAAGDLRGTMRLGAYETRLENGSKIAKSTAGTRFPSVTAIAMRSISTTKDRLREACGLVFAGMSPDGILPETIEYPDHPWFIVVQYHPELKSRPLDPSAVRKASSTRRSSSPGSIAPDHPAVSIGRLKVAIGLGRGDLADWRSANEM